MTAVTPAERILMGLGIQHSSEIDLEAIAWSLGAAVDYRALHGCEALIVGSANRAVIVVNSGGRPERQRFSVGHEIGHWHHHRGQQLLCGPNDIGNPRNGPLNPERQADNFASDLILPNYLLQPILMKICRVTIAVAREIADQFKVSRTATLIKMAQSNRFPIVLACHSRDGLEWSWPAPMVPRWCSLPIQPAGRMRRGLPS